MQIDKNNWQIQVTEKNREEIIEYLGKDELYNYHINHYYGKRNSETVFFPTSHLGECSIITTDQFRKYILGKKEPKFKVGDKVIIIHRAGALEDREFAIIQFNPTSDFPYKVDGCWYQEEALELVREDRKLKGYAAPFDMWDGKIRKGKLFIWDEDNKNNYRSEGGIYTFPSELVEAFFTPIYEEEKVIELHGYRITKDSIKLIGGEFEYKNELPKYIKMYQDVLKAYEELNK